MTGGLGFLILVLLLWCIFRNESATIILLLILIAFAIAVAFQLQAP